MSSVWPVGPVGLPVSGLNDDDVIHHLSVIQWDDWVRQGGLPHGFFGRSGGVSQGPYAGLNGAVAGTADDPVHGHTNRQLALKALGLSSRQAMYPQQEHTTTVYHVTGPQDAPQGPVDALVTTSGAVALCVLTADCAPVLLWDQRAGVIGAAHAGWRGALGGIVAHTVAAMIRLGATTAGIEAVIGPTIRWPHYPVSLAWVEAHAQDPWMSTMIHWVDGCPHFDLAGYLKASLSPSVGRVDDVGVDTYGDVFFSRRYALDHAMTETHAAGSEVSNDVLPFGRNMSWIALPHTHSL